MHHTMLKLLNIYLENVCVCFCNEILIYHFMAADFHLPAVWSSAYFQPWVAAIVVAPIRNECDVKWTCIPKCPRAFFSTVENWYRDSGLHPKWQKKEPSIFGISTRNSLTYSKTDNEPSVGGMIMVVHSPIWFTFWMTNCYLDICVVSKSTSVLNSGWPIFFKLHTVILPTRKTPKHVSVKVAENICAS